MIERYALLPRKEEKGREGKERGGKGRTRKTKQGESKSFHNTQLNVKLALGFLEVEVNHKIQQTVT